VGAKYPSGSSNTGTRSKAFVSNFSQRSFERGNGSEDIAIAHKTQVTNPEDFPFEMVLSASEDDVEPLFHHATDLL
jgi:hypothetical protein